MPERGSAVSGSPSEVKVTAQVTDQAGNPSGLLTTRPRWTTWRPRRRAWNLQGAVRRTYNKAEIGDDNSVDRQGDAECWAPR
ncbi:hypothetical protein C0708_22605 [Aeromonas caviae]|nr:hypothetical protein C0708_22605 [Aeromonas caviae]